MDNNDYDSNPIDTEPVESEAQEVKHKKLPSALSEIIIYAIIFIVCAFIIPRYVVQKTIVDGDSMEATLQDSDRLLINKLSYQFKNPERFDIVVFYPYGKELDEYYVKRVIGLPGETIQIIGEDIYINGEILEENYGKDPIEFAGIASKPLKLKEDEFFLLGDNREISLDSRYEEVGPIHKDLIAGHAVLRVMPFKHFGFVK